VSSVTFFAGAVPVPRVPARTLHTGGISSTVYIDGPRVWIDTVCLLCRADTRQLSIADLALVTDEQLALLQAAAGLPSTPLLTDADAWKRALGA
jgi:hypothetical protein